MGTNELHPYFVIMLINIMSLLTHFSSPLIPWLSIVPSSTIQNPTMGSNGETSSTSAPILPLPLLGPFSFSTSRNLPWAIYSSDIMTLNILWLNPASISYNGTNLYLLGLYQVMDYENVMLIWDLKLGICV